MTALRSENLIREALVNKQDTTKMAEEAENNLTPGENSDIIPTEDEKRILTNLRRYAKMYPHSELAVLFKVHDGLIQYGTLCLGVGSNMRL